MIAIRRGRLGTLDLNSEGSITCEYDLDTGEVLGIEDWNGNEPCSRTIDWALVAEQRVAEAMAKAAKESA